MKKEAEENAADDHARKEEAEAKNKADSLVYQTEKNLKEYGDKVPADAKAKIEPALNRAREALKGGKVSDIRSAAEDLERVWQEAAQQMYQQTAGSAGGPGGAAKEGGAPGSKAKQGSKDDVVDAEVLDDDKDKK